ncbi:hypothetical protein [Nonomuraea basaltis]|uniref:hypothetical protein n=1 Tax=Nonomuraea basaltis TaxID=2495887 RepID=UPI00110C6017|nr:hypothetical protein [Nonomuraea basaltis]TMR93188.1 hypothetical protein EJK15_40615 [Nonomuraea basaltis]
MRGRLFPVGKDWYEWRQEPPLSGTVLVRIAVAAGGRLVLTGLRIDGAPTAELLRSIPVGRIEAAANAQLTAVDDVITPVAASRRRQAELPSLNGEGWEMTTPDHALPRPPPAQKRGRPDGFYREIADTYHELAQTSARPAAELAELRDIPITTAHRWVKEARRRGFLPPGRPGTSG